MVKKAFVLILFLVSIFSYSQDIVTEITNDFDVIKVYNGLHVELYKSDKQRVEISGEKAESVLVKNSKGRLKISLKLKSLFDSKQVKIKLYYSGNLDELDVNQGAVITSSKQIEQVQIELSAQDGGYIKLDLKVEYLKANAITGGNLQLKGSAKSQNIELSTGGNYEAYALKSKQVSISAASGAEAEITVDTILDAKVKLGGTITYKGSPKSVKTTKVLGGVVSSFKEI
jgi:hypothetical protein